MTERKTTTVFSLKFAKALLQEGFQICDIDLNKTKHEGFVFHFYDDEGKIRNFINTLAEQKKKYELEKQSK